MKRTNKYSKVGNEVLPIIAKRIIQDNDLLFSNDGFVETIKLGKIVYGETYRTKKAIHKMVNKDEYEIVYELSLTIKNFGR